MVEVFWLVEVEGLPPGIDQFHVEIGSPEGEIEASVNETAFPMHAGLGVNCACGNAVMVTVLVATAEQPAEQVTV